MARNKRGREMTAGYKTKEDVQLAKTTGAYEIEVSENIVESSSKPLSEKEKKARDEHKAQRALRRAKRARIKSNTSSGTDNTPKTYDVLALYHQLNYDAVQAALKELNIKASLIDNNRLWLFGIDQETFDKVKNALIKCHFETKQGKQYKVRIAGYKHNAVIKTEKKAKKPTNNKPAVSLAAKKKRKANNLKRAEAMIGHKERRTAAGKLRSQHKADHKPGVADTSSHKRKLSDRIKKACKAISKAEKIKSSEVKKTAKIGRKKKPIQREFKFAA